MNPTTRTLIRGASGVSSVTSTAQLTAPLLFPTSRNSAGQTYVHGVRTDGTLVGSWLCPVNDTMHAFFYNPFLVIYSAGGTTGYIVNCNTMSTHLTFSGASRSGYAPWQDGQYLSVNGMQNRFEILQIPSGTSTVYTYDTDAGYSDVATNHMTVGFAENGSNLFTTIGSRYWWSIGQFVSPYPCYYYYADKTSATSLGTRSSGYNSNSNYSRTYGISLSATQAMYCNIGSYFFLVYSSSTSPVSFTPGSLLYGGVYHLTGADSTDVNPRCGVNNQFYSVYEGSSGSYDYRYRIGYISPASSTVPIDIGINLKSKSTSSTGEYYKMQNGTFMSQINTSGYVAVAYWDIDGTGDYNTNQLKISIRNGSAVIADVTTTAISASMTSGNNPNYIYHGINGCSWSSNLLYSGTTYS